jgi:hypothetical protein
VKVWEKISQLNDTKGWDKERIAAECYQNKYCPAEIEAEHNFIGTSRFAKHCYIGCGVKCLEEYLKLEVKETGKGHKP